MAGKNLAQFKMNLDEEIPLTNGQPTSLQPILEVEDKEGRPVETATHNNAPAEEQPSNHNSASMEEEIQVDSDNGIKGGEANSDIKEGNGLRLFKLVNFISFVHLKFQSLY